MPAIFSRLKNFVAETLTASDVNAEFDNILDNFEPDQMDDYSENVTEMRTKTSPGTVGSESLATTTAGEIERIRHMLSTIIGKTQWYEAPTQSLESLASSVGGGISSNRVVSGLERSGSSQLVALVPAGSGNGRTVDIKGAGTNFVYAVNDTEYTISTDVSSSAITAAPSTNNTCLVNDAYIDDSDETKFIGEYGSSITVDTMGSEITTLVGEYAGFKINNGSDDEYFTARVKSSTELTEVRRGHFFSSSSNPVPRVPIANNDTITLLRLSYMFANTAGALVAVNSQLIIAKDEPSSPSLGQYWFDIVNDTWKTYNGSAFVSADATLIGVALTDDTDTLAARTLDQFKNIDNKNTIEVEIKDNTEVSGIATGQECNVFGTEIKFSHDVPTWDMDSDLDSGITEAARTLYYLYLTEDGDTVISDLAPASLYSEYQGLYHPYQTWRGVGQVYNDGSSNLTSVLNYTSRTEEDIVIAADLNTNALEIRILSNPGRPRVFPNGASLALLPEALLTISSGSTLGTINGVESEVVVHLIAGAARAEPAASLLTHLINGDSTAEGGAGAADSSSILYSKIAQTDADIVAIGKIVSTQATAGTWATAASAVYSGYGGRKKQNIAVFNASGSYTVPAGVKRICLYGGGGGGGAGGAGGSNTTTGSGGGGGGGAGQLIEKHFETVVPNEVITVTIGAAGTGGAGGAAGVVGSVGVAGGSTSAAAATSGWTITALGGGYGGYGGRASGSGNAGSAGGAMIAGGGSGGAVGSNRGGGGGGGGSWGAGSNGSSGSAGAGAGTSSGGDSPFGGGGSGGVGGHTSGTNSAGTGGQSNYAASTSGASSTGNTGGAGGTGGTGFAVGAVGGAGTTSTSANDGVDAAVANSCAGGGGGGGCFNGGAGGGGGNGSAGVLFIGYEL